MGRGPAGWEQISNRPEEAAETTKMSNQSEGIHKEGTSAPTSPQYSTCGVAGCKKKNARFVHGGCSGAWLCPDHRHVAVSLCLVNDITENNRTKKPATREAPRTAMAFYKFAYEHETFDDERKARKMTKTKRKNPTPARSLE